MTRIGTQAPPAHARSAVEVMQRLDVDAGEGLSTQEAARRLERDGPNRLAEARREPRWRAFLRQFQDLLIIILLVAAVVSLVVTREWETPVVIALVVLLNATIGFVQESKAEASLEALKKMLVTTATVRRDGRMVSLDAAELVAGDVVVLQAGDRVPADGRLVSASGLEVQESSLTGEAQPVAKSATDEVDRGRAAGRPQHAVFMNTTVTRGRAEFVVTATGMGTEIGRIAGHAARGRAGAHAAAAPDRRAEPDLGDDRRRGHRGGVRAGAGPRAGLRRRCSSARCRWPSRPSRRGCPRWSRSPWPWAPPGWPAAARSSSGWPRWRRWAAPRRSAPTRPAP